MSGRRITGIVLICLGVLLVGAALGLLLYNRQQAQAAEAASQQVMVQLGERIREQVVSAVPLPAVDPPIPAASPEEPLPEEQEEPQEEDMPVVEIDGYSYIGFLTIPDLKLELPVMDHMDYNRLYISPCRYSGTLKDGNLVIGAHNYIQHFAYLHRLKQGAEILFTDANGELTTFTVEEMEVLAPTAIEQMTAGEYALTLFTCTYSGRTRFTVRCSPVET